MNKKVLAFKKRKRLIEEHSGIIKLKKDRSKLKRNFAAKTKIALENKLEYKLGCKWIKNILKYKKENELLYVTGRQASGVLKKYPELNNPKIIKSILIASINPDLTIKKINSMLIELFNKKISEKERVSVILSMIRIIDSEHYDYLMY